MNPHKVYSHFLQLFLAHLNTLSAKFCDKYEKILKLDMNRYRFAAAPLQRQKWLRQFLKGLSSSPLPVRDLLEHNGGVLFRVGGTRFCLNEGEF